MTMPSRAEATLLPALLALVLAMLLLFQLAAAPGDATSDAAGTGYGRVRMPHVTDHREQPREIDPGILRAAIFTPVRTPGGSDAEPVALGPLGDAAPVGVTRARGATRIIIERTDGRIFVLPIGGRYNDWRITGADRTSVMFTGPGGKTRIPLADRPISTGRFNPPQPDTR